MCVSPLSERRVQKAQLLLQYPNCGLISIDTISNIHYVSILTIFSTTLFSHLSVVNSTVAVDNRLEKLATKSWTF